MTRIIVYPCKSGWGLRNPRRLRALGFYRLRRDAISAAKTLAGKGGVVTVHNSKGEVVIRVPELKPTKVAAAVHIRRAATMSPGGRRRIAAWLTHHAEMLVKEGKNYAAGFRGLYFYGSH